MTWTDRHPASPHPPQSLPGTFSWSFIAPKWFEWQRTRQAISGRPTGIPAIGPGRRMRRRGTVAVAVTISAYLFLNL